ncbi:MAG: RNA polymerase sigma factor [Armatimonadota bacterium]
MFHDLMELSARVVNLDHCGETIAIALGMNGHPVNQPGMTREQYERFVMPLSQSLMRAALRLTYPDLALAEDLVQASMIRGYQLLTEGRFEAGPGSLSWFIRGITCDFLAHRRKERRCDIMPPDSSVFANIEELETPESLFIAPTMSEEISEALDQLPADQRACIELIDFAECSYIEASRILGVPVGTVKSRLSRARLTVGGQLTRDLESK